MGGESIMVWRLKNRVAPVRGYSPYIHQPYLPKNKACIVEAIYDMMLA
jgi:hypothetical protein